MSLEPQSGGGGPFEPQTLRVFANALVALVLVLAVSVIRVPTVRPDVVTLVVVYLALEQEFLLGLLLAVGIGYVSDLFSGHGPGLNASVAGLVYLTLRLFVARLAGGRGLMVSILALFATALALVLRLLIEGTIGPNHASFGGLLAALPWIVLGPVALAYPVYRVMRGIDRRFRPREEFTFGSRGS